MMKRSPTIIDVAAQAGVSIATVSRVLNDDDKVTSATREAVQVAIQHLGYRRNTLARGLVTGKTGVIGVLIPDVLGPLYGQMARGIEDVLIPLGIHFMMVSDNRNPEEEQAAIELLLERQIDALIVIGSYLTDVELDRLNSSNIPIILMQRENPCDATLYNLIQLDNQTGVKDALHHLIEMGHRNIVHVAGVRYDGLERKRVFVETMKDAGLKGDVVLCSDGTEEGGFKAAHDLNDYPDVTAVFCNNDRTALGLYHGLKTQGKKIPDDVSVIGFDDVHWSAYLDPPLTTIQQPGRNMGQVAAQQALDALKHPEQVSTQNLSAQLIKRASVKPLKEV